MFEAFADIKIFPDFFESKIAKATRGHGERVTGAPLEVDGDGPLFHGGAMVKHRYAVEIDLAYHPDFVTQPQFPGTPG